MTNFSDLLQDMKKKYKKTLTTESENSDATACSNSLSYVFVKPSEKPGSQTEKSITEFLNGEGVFQINLPEAFKM